MDKTIGTLTKTIEKLQIKFNEKEAEMVTLTSHDARYENLNHLQDSFMAMN